MARFKYTFLSGEDLVVEDAAPDVVAFIKRLTSMVTDPTVTESAFIEVLHGLENPLLDKELMPGRASVTRAIFADPLYHVMQDLLGRKRITLGSLDMNKVRERYSMTVAEAAALRGVHESAIRQAIAAKRLSSVKLEGKHMLDPEQVRQLEGSKRGPPAPLEVVYGSAPGSSFSIRHDGELTNTKRDGGLRSGEIRQWTSASVIAHVGEKARFWRIEPGPEQLTIASGPFRISGRFRKVDSTNNAREAVERFKATRPAVHVMPHPHGAGWLVKRGDVGFQGHATKKEATAFGRKMAAESESELVVQDPEGAVISRETPGDTPQRAKAPGTKRSAAH